MKSVKLLLYIVYCLSTDYRTPTRVPLVLISARTAVVIVTLMPKAVLLLFHLSQLYMRQEVCTFMYFKHIVTCCIVCRRY